MKKTNESQNKQGQGLRNLMQLNQIITSNDLANIVKDIKSTRIEIDKFFAKVKEREHFLENQSKVVEQCDTNNINEQAKEVVEEPAPQTTTTTFIVDNTRNQKFDRPNTNTSYNNQRPSYNNYNNNRTNVGTNNGTNNYNRPYNSQNSQNPQRPFNTQSPQRPYNAQSPQRPYNSQNPQRPFNAQSPQRPFNNNFNKGFVPRPKQEGPSFGNNKFENKKPEYAPTFTAPKFNKFSNANGKSKYNKDATGEKHINKRQLILNSIEENILDGREYTRKLSKKKEKAEVVVAAAITKATITSENISVKDLSEKIGKSAAEIIKKLFILGTMATINSVIDFASAELVANDLGIELELKAEKSAEEVLEDTICNVTYKDEEMVKRPPIIAVMGHVDHGKTSLLDAIRKTNVASGEAGGITQRIGAYTIKKGDRNITFIDTPGHAAFTAMRARGAKVTDIAVLVVAADDGIMPQTIEAIDHIKAAKVPMIVAINKIDKPHSNIEKIKQQLADNNVLPEEWGGDAILVPVSAKTGEGLEKLLEMMLLVADIQDLKANINRPAIGTVIEAKLDRGRGPVATVLVQDGTLKIGNTVVSGTTTGRIRAMIDDNGKNVVSVGPSIAVAVLGFEDVPNAGDSVQVVDEKLSKQIIQERKAKLQLEKIKHSGGVTLEELMNLNPEIKNLNVIIKADVQGSIEALKTTIEGLSNNEIYVNCIHGGVGNVTETDILLAQASKAFIVAFNIKTEAKIASLAEKSDVEIKSYKVIYEAVDDIKSAMKGIVGPKYKEVIIGHAEIRMVFKLSTSGTVAGSIVKDGVIRRNAKARILRNDKELFTTKIESVKIVKDDVKEAREGYECGIKLSNNDFAEGDIIEAFVEEEIKE